MTISHKPAITFFHSDNCERQALSPIAREAERRGFAVRFSTDPRERAQVGVYCQHACQPNAEFSVIMLHDLAQRHDIWPAFWDYEPWNAFDMGFVPGEDWVRRWRSQSEAPGAHPRLGVFDIGWPKADLIGHDREEFDARVRALRASLDLPHPRTVLYAPSWENHGKQDDFVRALMDLPVNLLLKQAPWPETYPAVLDNIRAMNALHDGIAGNVRIVDPEISIMYCIGLSDVLVSDESSVLLEAALHEVPSVAVMDWLIPDSDPPRPASVPYGHVRKTTRAALRSTVEEILRDPAQARAEARRLRDFHFSHFGDSSALAMELLDAALEGRPSPVSPLVASERTSPPGPAAGSMAQVHDAYRFNRERGIYERPKPPGFAYNDGDHSEQRVWSIISGAADVSLGSDELIAQADDWPTLYHLSPARGNLFRPIESALRGKKVLELGSGCGAMSRFLGEAGCALTCVEGSHRRASITAARCRGLPNVRVFNDNFQNFETDERFDVVTLIGVLEYSRMFIEGDDPIAAALELARGFLKPDGVVVIAIENKLGLKYWAGAPEDHIGIPFCGVESLYGAQTAVTFGKRELAGILRKADFGALDFYYPYPDYKLPTMVLTEQGVEEADPAILHNLLSSAFAPDQSGAYLRTFSEGAAQRALVDNGLVGDMANSFLVVARKGEGNWRKPEDDYAFTFSTVRRKALAKEVRISRDAAGGGAVVRRRMLHGERPAWMRFEDEPVLPGEILFNGLLPLVNRAGWGVADLCRWIQPLCRALERESRLRGGERVLPGRFFDATPFNFIGDERQGYRWFDLEWEIWPEIDASLPVFRGLLHSFSRIGTVAAPSPGTPLGLADLAATVVRQATGWEVDVDAHLAREVGFMEAVVLGRVVAEAYKMARIEVRPSLGQLRAQAAAGPGGPQASGSGNALGTVRVAVVLHVFYPALWTEFVLALRVVPAGTDIFITAPSEHMATVRGLLERDLPHARLMECENRGRDIRPFFAVLDAVRLEDYDFVLKLHTKRSPHLEPGRGDAWRHFLLAELLPADGLAGIFDQFRDHPDVGLLAPQTSLADIRDERSLGENREAMRAWAARLGLDFDTLSFHFASGSMFWARGAAMAALRALQVKPEDFEPETGRIDGTVAHALERSIAMAVMHAGMQVGPIESGDSALAKLARRAPSLTQGQLIEQRLREQGGGPSIAVIVRARGADEKVLMRTLESLAYGRNLYANVKVVLIGSEPAGGTTHEDRVHLLQADDSTEVDTVNLAALQSGCDWIMLADAGDEFTRSGLLMTALKLADLPGCRAVYGDEIRRTAQGGLGAAFRPGFNLDLLLSLPAGMARHWLVRRDVLLQAGGFDPAFAQALEFDLVVRLIDSGGIDGLEHVDEVLMTTRSPVLQDNPVEQQVLERHLAHRGYEEAVVESTLPGRYRIRYGHAGKPLVSIIVPTKDQLPVLQRCIESLLEKTSYPHYELLIVDNASETADARQWLDGVAAMGSDQVRVLRYPHPFNYSAINNMAAREARGEYLVLLNNDTAIVRADWLEAMLNHAQRPEVGIVGAKLLYPSGKIQHAGVVLGLRGPADHPFLEEPMDAVGHMNRLQVDQDYSAVTAACLMVRKSIYEEVGGLDEEAFKVSYNDVDLCLKVRTAGHLVVWTPHAVVMHEGSVSQARVDTAQDETKRARFSGEQEAMYARWLPLLARDPAYNRHLTLHGPGFQLEPDPDMVWRPLPWHPVPVVLALPADDSGCGHYRVMQPFHAMLQASIADGRAMGFHLNEIALEQHEPDTVVFQRQLEDFQVQGMVRAKRFSRAFRVYELDDYLPGVPLKSAHRTQIPADILKALRKAVSHADRFVVSTDVLADAFSSLHPDIRVVRNLLPVPWWGDVLQGRMPRRKRKPRVGWAGGIGHRGDLELIADVVEELADEVEWVFMGMCPDKLRPFVHEVRQGVAIEDYPRELARLDLDLALAPLEENLFNECKSNLRLLEYGACGFPVVCSDLRCYRDPGLPVTRVKNRFKDWVGAIRMHTHDLEAAARAGDALRAAVKRDWMLEGQRLVDWRDAWLPD